MKSIKGIAVKEFPFQNLEMVGMLLYHEYPTTTIYDNNGNPVVIEWVDCDDTGEVDTFFAFETDIRNLDRFLNSDISHFEFIHSAKRNFAVMFEGSIGREKDPRIVYFEDFPKEYLPAIDVYFNKKEGVELEKILEHFNLEYNPKIEIRFLEKELVIPREAQNLSQILPPALVPMELVKSIAEQTNTEVINIHIREGNKIKYGTAETKALGDILTSFDELYKAAALDYFEGPNRAGIKKFNTQNRKSLYNKISTEVFLNQAASYSIYIRPIIRDQQLDFDSTTDSGLITERIFNLFKVSSSKSELGDSYNQFSHFVYKSYIDFLQIIKETKVEVDYNYYSPFNKHTFEEHFNFKKAWQLLGNIKELSQSDTDIFSFIAKFSALNCNTGHYTLNNEADDIFSGHFDKLIKESMKSLNFYDLYEVKITRKIIKETGRIEPKIEDIIISCLHTDRGE